MPSVPLIGVIVKITPLQVVVLNVLMVAAGLIVTVTVNGLPAPQLMVAGVTIYVAVTARFVVFNKLPNMSAAPVVCDNPPVKPEPVGTVHVYVVPAGTIPFVPLTGDTVNATPLHEVVVMAVMPATGFSVTTTVKD